MGKKKDFIINTLYYAIILGLVYLTVNYVLGIILPFILGFLFAYAAIALSKKIFSQDKTIFKVITLLLIYVVITIVIWLIVSLGVSKIGDFLKTLPGFYKNTLEPYISSLEVSLNHYSSLLPTNISGILSNATGDIFDALKSLLSSLASTLMNVTTSALSSAPQMLITLIVTIVTSFYCVTDYEILAKWFVSFLPEKTTNIINEIKDFFENNLLKIFSAYAIIMFITFVELFIGLSLFKVSNSAMWAFIISLLDILPVLGVGTVLIPWGISSLITGNIILGIELLVLYVIISFIRNIIEPKMVGSNLGLHPLATLFSMIVGLKLFGAVGMFGFPLAISFYKTRKDKLKLKAS